MKRRKKRRKNNFLNTKKGCNHAAFFSYRNLRILNGDKTGDNFKLYHCFILKFQKQNVLMNFSLCFDFKTSSVKMTEQTIPPIQQKKQLYL